MSDLPVDTYKTLRLYAEHFSSILQDYDGDYLYHYTAEDVVNLITKDGQLHLTNTKSFFRDSDDHKEIEHFYDEYNLIASGYPLLEKYDLKNLTAAPFINYYVFSSSGNKKNHFLKDKYSKGCNKILKICVTDVIQRNRYYSKIAKVYYSDNEKKKHITDLIEKFIDHLNLYKLDFEKKALAGAFRLYLDELAPFFKREQFSKEEEIRIVVSQGSYLEIPELPNEERRKIALTDVGNIEEIEL
jgi:hypothetical protein